MRVSPAEVSTVLRQRWAEEVSAVGARDTSRDAPVMRALQSAIEAMPNIELATVEELVDSVICDTDDWKKVHRQTISTLYESIRGFEPPDSDVEKLWRERDMDRLAERISDMSVDSPCSAVRDDSDDDAADQIDRPEAKDAEDVDDAWMAEFADAYGRDATVYEYVRLRPMDMPLNETAQEHRRVFYAMREVYLQYFDRQLDEIEFVRRYVPLALADGTTLVESERQRALDTAEYQQAMLSRLTQLYAMMSGENLSETECAHLFDTRVREKRLPLDTEELSDIVAEYVNASESMRTTIQTIFKTYLDREAHFDELSAWLPRLRMRPDQQTLLRHELADSHEFHAVLAEIICTQDPHKSRRDQFRTLGEVVRSSGEDLKGVQTADDLRRIVARYV